MNLAIVITRMGAVGAVGILDGRKTAATEDRRAAELQKRIARAPKKDGVMPA